MACDSCFDLPCSGIRLIISEDDSRLDADALAIAAMEKLEGFGAFVWLTLVCPPDLPIPTEEQYRENWTRQMISYYHRLFSGVSGHKVSSVTLTLLGRSWSHNKLLMDMMAEALTSYIICPPHRQLSLKTVTVVVQGNAFDYFHICITTCLRAMAQSQSDEFHRTIQKSYSLEDLRPTASWHQHPSRLGRPLSPVLHTQTTSTSTSGASTSSAPSLTNPLAQLDMGWFGDQLRRIFPSFFQSSHRLKTNGCVPVSSFDRVKGLERQKLHAQFFLGQELPHHTFGTGVPGEWCIYPWGDVFEHPSASQSRVTDGPSSRESSQTSGVVIPVQTPRSQGSNSSGFPSSMEMGQCEQLYSRIFVLGNKADALLTYHVTGNASHSQGGPLSVVRNHYSQYVKGYQRDVLDFYVTDMAVQARSDSGNETRLSRNGENDENDDSSRQTPNAARQITEEDLIEPSQADQALSVQTTGSDREVDVNRDCDDFCAICLDVLRRPTKLNQCGHVFCRTCLEQSFQQHPRCPMCNFTFAVVSGNMPDGRMDVCGRVEPLPGYEDYHSIVINYFIPSGLQGPCHPNRGQAFSGAYISRAYLPACEEGVKVCRLLWVAFMFRHTFTIGRSLDTGYDNVVIWNGINHQTSRTGGPSRFGYPDPGYLRRVTEELAAKGITEELVKHCKVPF